MRCPCDSQPKERSIYSLPYARRFNRAEDRRGLGAVPASTLEARTPSAEAILEHKEQNKEQSASNPACVNENDVGSTRKLCERDQGTYQAKRQRLWLTCQR